MIKITENVPANIVSIKELPMLVKVDNLLYGLLGYDYVNKGVELTIFNEAVGDTTFYSYRVDDPANFDASAILDSAYPVSQFNGVIHIEHNLACDATDYCTHYTKGDGNVLSSFSSVQQSSPEPVAGSTRIWKWNNYVIVLPKVIQADPYFVAPFDYVEVPRYLLAVVIGDTMPHGSQRLPIGRHVFLSPDVIEPAYGSIILNGKK